MDIYVHVMGGCNLSCRYCWYETGELSYSRTRLTPLDLDTWLKQLESTGIEINSVILTGGEPMIHRQFRQFVDVAVTRVPNVVVLTNGTLMTTEWADMFQEKKIGVHISIDSLTEEHHNTWRGRHADVKEAIRLLEKCEVSNRRMVTVVNRENIDEIPLLWEYSLAHGFSIEFQPADIPTTDDAHLANCTPEEVTKLNKFLRPWAQMNEKMYYIGFFTIVTTGASLPLLRECPFAERSLIIDSDGSVYACFQKKLLSWKLGNIVYDDIVSIMKKRALILEDTHPTKCLELGCLGVF